jgi:hypothetical protein
MKKITYVLAILCSLVFCSYTSTSKNYEVMMQKAGPAGVYITTFTVDFGPYAGTYEAYADQDDPTQLIKVVNLQTGTKFVSGSGSPATVGNPGSYSFTFNDDPNSETYGFVYEVH